MASIADAPPSSSSSNYAFDARGKVIVVTGGTRGIGLGIARAFAERHSAKRVYIASRSARDGWRSSDGVVVELAVDLSTVEGAETCAREIERCGDDRVHVLVHNSGTSWGSALETHEDEGWKKTYALNVVGVFHLTRALLPALARASSARDPSRVIIIGSTAGITPQSYPTFSYDASKAAVHHLARKLADEFATRRKLHVTVNVIAPGYVPTKMSKGLEKYDGGSSEDIVRERVPLGRAGTPEDVAGAVAFLASDAASWITGVVLPVDGGFLAKL